MWCDDFGIDHAADAGSRLRAGRESMRPSQTDLRTDPRRMYDLSTVVELAIGRDVFCTRPSDVEQLLDALAASAATRWES